MHHRLRITQILDPADPPSDIKIKSIKRASIIIPQAVHEAAFEVLTGDEVLQ